MKNLATALMMVCFLSAPILEAQRRVFTNENIATTPPPAPAAAESIAAAPEGDAPAASEAPAGLPKTPLADLNRAKAIQATFMGIYDEIAAKASEEPIPIIRQRWTEIIDWLASIIQANQKTIEELQVSLGIEPPADAEIPISTQSAPPAIVPTPPSPPAQ